MKNYPVGILLVIILFSCRKNVEPSCDIVIVKAKKLFMNMSADEFGKVDWNKVMRIEELEDYIWVGFKNKDFGRDFLLIKFFKDSIESNT